MMTMKRCGVILVLLLAACRGSADKAADPAEPKSRPAPQARETEEAAEEKAPEKTTPLHVIVGGDVMLQMEIIETAALHADEGDPASGWEWFFKELRPLFEAHPEAPVIVNLESPVAEQRVESRSFPPTFNGPPEALEGMKAAGIDIVTLANNHALDQKRQGLEETIENARKAGLTVVGAGLAGEAKNPAFIGGEGGAPRIAVFSYLVPPGSREEPVDKAAIALYAEESPGEVRSALESGEADAALVILHWIGEFAEKPSQEWRNVVESFVAAGAEAVVCHGPHVVGPVEWVEAGGRKGFAAFSLGNLLANFGWEIYPTNFKNLVVGKDSAQRIKARQEALAVLRFDPAPGKNGNLLGRVRLYPLWLEDNRYVSFRKGSGKRAIFPMLLPTCRPADETGCPRGSKPVECGLRWDMILQGGQSVMDGLWGKGWPDMKPCPEGDDAASAGYVFAEF
jgi:hypothetical protein